MSLFSFEVYDAETSSRVLLCKNSKAIIQLSTEPARTLLEARDPSISAILVIEHSRLDLRYPLSIGPAMDFTVEPNLYACQCAYVVVQLLSVPVGKSQEFAISSKAGERDHKDIEFCICGRPPLSIEVNWIQCERCDTWSHAQCYTSRSGPFRRETGLRKHCRVDDVHNLIGGFVCALCRDLKAELADNDDERVYRQLLNERDELALKAIAAYLGPSSERLRMGPVECRLTRRAVDYARTLIHGVTGACIDLGSGSGNFTKCLPKGSLGVENDAELYKQASKAPELSAYKFLRADYCTRAFLSEHRGKYSCVVSNPDFAILFETIYVGLQLVKDDGFILLLAPSDFFNRDGRAGLYSALCVRIAEKHELGFLPYLEDMGERRNSDSFFLLRPGRVSKYEFKTVMARAAGLLPSS